jgi:hypothetical protein
MRAAVLLLLIACGPRPQAATEPPRETHEAKAPEAEPPGPECIADADCVVMPELSCCEECPPAAPFAAGTRAALDAALIENEERCANKDVDCAQQSCPPQPCEVRAVCEAGRCAAIADGC